MNVHLKKQTLNCQCELKDEDADLEMLSSANTSTDASLATGRRLNKKEKIGNLGGNLQINECYNMT